MIEMKVIVAAAECILAGASRAVGGEAIRLVGARDEEDWAITESVEFVPVARPVDLKTE